MGEGGKEVKRKNIENDQYFSQIINYVFADMNNDDFDTISVSWEGMTCKNNRKRPILMFNPWFSGKLRQIVTLLRTCKCTHSVHYYVP